MTPNVLVIKNKAKKTQLFNLRLEEKFLNMIMFMVNKCQLYIKQWNNKGISVKTKLSLSAEISYKTLKVEYVEYNERIRNDKFGLNRVTRLHLNIVNA